MQPGAFGDSVAASGANQEEPFAWVDPGATVKVLSSEPIEKSGVDLQKADVVVAAGRGFGLESDLDMARALCDKLEAGLGCTASFGRGYEVAAAGDVHRCLWAHACS